MFIVSFIWSLWSSIPEVNRPRDRNLSYLVRLSLGMGVPSVPVSPTSKSSILPDGYTVIPSVKLLDAAVLKPVAWSWIWDLWNPLRALGIYLSLVPGPPYAIRHPRTCVWGEW